MSNTTPPPPPSFTPPPTPYPQQQPMPAAYGQQQQPYVQAPPAYGQVPPGYLSPQQIGQSGGLPAGVSPAGAGLRFGSYLLESVLMVVTLYIGWIIWAAILSSHGQTPAKKILGVRVIDATTLKPVGFGKMFFMRGLVASFVAAIAIPITLGILLFMPFWDKRNQNIWDKVSGTYVVTDPNDAWGTKTVMQ